MSAGELRQILRFILVGAVNTATFYGFYRLLLPWMPYFGAYTIAFLLSMLGSFFMNTYFTYRTRPTWKKLLLFPLTNITNFVVQSAGLFALVHWMGLDKRYAPLVAAVVAIPVTYLLSRRILVPKKEGNRPGGSGQAKMRKYPHQHRPERDCKKNGSVP
ncbi:GtrA family protein [Streptomyces sp. NPDC002516]